MCNEQNCSAEVVTISGLTPVYQARCTECGWNGTPTGDWFSALNEAASRVNFEGEIDYAE